LQIEGSAHDNYILTVSERLMNHLTGTRRWTQVFAKQNNPIGFLTAITSHSQAKGTLARPVIADDDLPHLPAMLHEAATWLAQLDKTTMQLAIPNVRPSLISDLQNQGWNKTQTWVRLVKYL